MSKKEKLLEWFKTGLIIFLLLAAAFLLVRTDYYDYAFEYIAGMFTSAKDSIQPSDNAETASVSSAKIEPMAVSVYLGAGSRHASVYDRESILNDYQRFSVYLAEALGSAGEPVESNRQSWLNALGGQSVYFRFLSPQPLSFLSGVLGTQMSSSAGLASSEELCIACEDNSVRLYYRADAGYYFCSTGVSADALRARLMEFVPNGAYFSHEISSLSDLRESILVPETLPPIKSIVSGGTCSQARMKDLSFEPFEINEYTVSEYMEGDGKIVYLDTGGSLHISTGGIVEYFGNGSSGINSVSSGLENVLSLSWNIINRTLSEESGFADIFYSHTIQEGNVTKVYFSYSANSIPISLSGGGYAAEFEFTGSRLSYAKLCFRNFTVVEDIIDVPPLTLAAAIAYANGSSSIKLTYSESGTGINCVWVPQ